MIVDVRPRSSGKTRDLLLWMVKPEPNELRLLVVVNHEHEKFVERMLRTMNLPDGYRRNIYTIEDIVGRRALQGIARPDVRILVAFDDVDIALDYLLRGRGRTVLVTCSSDDEPDVFRWGPPEPPETSPIERRRFGELDIEE